jgi:extradiol dioxygenase family protein
MLTPFHTAVTVRDIPEAREFYGTKLGFPEGRSAADWVDFDMFGHQFVVHLNTSLGKDGSVRSISNPVDGHGVPVPHCGVVLQFENWQRFADKLSEVIDNFIIEPYIRFAGQPGEQGTLFFAARIGNALEFKGFRDINRALFDAS